MWIHLWQLAEPDCECMGRRRGHGPARPAGSAPLAQRALNPINRDTVVTTSHGGWREECTAARSDRHLLVECCTVTGRPHPAPLLQGVVVDSVRCRLYQLG
ncbi:hypothetical protein NDU88_011667 [Pleurodeles waltl]|uniref:Uncharacterized protein n=1 Tax=Pleurodeles waltl TaxID=8319 RepID=A0AAV7QZF4_PLEWA|nr:hypothetical protein NDU88_011667 [Pleurodeles waltl]